MSLESESASGETRGPAKRILDDPIVIRALAHPLRIRLNELVAREGPITAAQAARQLGVSQALASHHLRQLGKYGFIEQAGAADNRERPWRSTATSYALVPADEEAGTAAEVLEQLLAERATGQLIDWQRRRDGYDRRWRDITGISQSLIYLTLDEAEELNRALSDLINPLVERRRLGDAAARPADAVPLDLTLMFVPLPPTVSGG